MTIVSAQFANPDSSAVIIKNDAGVRIAITLSGDDVSGGWREEYERYSQHGGYTLPFQDSTPPDTVEGFAASQGYGAVQLIILSDLERKLQAAELPLPAKAAAVRAWVDSVLFAFATGQEPQLAPFTFNEVQAEVLPILPQPQE